MYIQNPASAYTRQLGILLNILAGFFARASGKASHTHHPSQLQTTYKSMFIWNRSISFLCYCELAFLSDLYTDANLTTALPLLAHAASYRLCDKNNFCMLLRAAI